MKDPTFSHYVKRSPNQPALFNVCRRNDIGRTAHDDKVINPKPLTQEQAMKLCQLKNKDGELK